MSDHPRLARVLAGVNHATTNPRPGEPARPWCEALARAQVAAMPPAVADRLEDALDACRFVFPDGTPCEARGREPVHGAREGDWRHAYDPLVAP